MILILQKFYLLKHLSTCPSIILNFIIYRTTGKTIVSVESPSIEMEKKIVNTPLLPTKASAINEKSKNSPSNKNLKMEENIQLKPLQPALNKKYDFIFAKILFSSAS